MRNLDLLNDFGAPALVTVINVGTRASSATMFGQSVSEIAPYAIAGLGYLAVGMGWAGRHEAFVKNLAIAAAPLAFEKLYNRIKGTVVTGRPMSRVSRYPAPASESPFQGVRLV